jgi:endonuclease YncB( thermonuclease family)
MSKTSADKRGEKSPRLSTFKFWFIVGLIFGALLGGCSEASAKPKTFNGPFYAVPLRVVDGDTIIMYVGVWPTLFARTSVRVAGVDTPESFRNRAKCEKELREGRVAKEFARVVFKEALDARTALYVKISNVRLGKYAGRVVADVHVKFRGEWRDYAEMLISRGLAKKYDGGKKEGWCNERK